MRFSIQPRYGPELVVASTDNLAQVFVEAGVITRDSTEKDAGVAVSSNCSYRLPFTAGIIVTSILIVSLMEHIGLLIYYCKRHNGNQNSGSPSTSQESVYSMDADDSTRIDEWDRRGDSSGSKVSVARPAPSRLVITSSRLTISLGRTLRPHWRCSGREMYAFEDESSDLGIGGRGLVGTVVR